MVNFSYKNSIEENLNTTVAFIKSLYEIRYTSPTREASEGLLKALNDFGAKNLRYVYNSLIGYACLDEKLKMPEEKSKVKHYINNRESLYESMEAVRIMVISAVNDTSVMASDDEEREIATKQLGRAAKRLRWLIEAIEDAKW